MLAQKKQKGRALARPFHENKTSTPKLRNRVSYRYPSTDAAPQTYAVTKHTETSLHFCTAIDVIRILETLSPASHQNW
jgi:hypothetical protein